MLKVILFLGFCCSLVLVIGCEGDDSITPPVEEERTLTLEGEPVNAVYITSPEWVREHYSDTYSVPYSRMGWLPNYYAYELMWMSDEAAITRELVDSDDGKITVEITGCYNDQTWNMICSDPDNLRLVEEDFVKTSEATYDASYTYKILRPGKGYIGFEEIFPSDWGGPHERGMGIMYTCAPIEELYVEIDSITWLYEILEWCSWLSVEVSGTTNAHKLLLESYGDGITSKREISIDSEGAFSGRFALAFIHRGKQFLQTNSKIYVIGTVGLPKVIDLVNPLEEYEASNTP